MVVLKRKRWQHYKCHMILSMEIFILKFEYRMNHFDSKHERIFSFLYTRTMCIEAFRPSIYSWAYYLVVIVAIE